VDPNLIDPLLGLIDPFFGHGTFIAGLIRQSCPDADLLSLKLMGPDGVVDEFALLSALAALCDRQSAAQEPGGDPSQAVDVLSISLGYYHEEPGDVASDLKLRKALDVLRSQGILVAAAAGNNSTVRPMYPAGFSNFRDGSFVVGAEEDAGWPPLVSVGALNPDRSVALFSNGGSAVACHCPGAALVSTLPVVDSSSQAAVSMGAPDGEDRVAPGWRANLDPDNYTGFGTWSGTSFAAPVMAGAAAQALLADPALADVSPAACAARARKALTELGFTF